MLKYLLVVLFLCSFAQTTCSFRNGGMYIRLVGRGFDGDPPTNFLSPIASNNGNERISLKLGDFLSNTTNLFPTNHSTNASVSSFATKSVSLLQYSIAQIEKQMSLLWEMISIGRKALLLILVPTIVTQFRMLQATVPFCIEHIMQYLHPLNIGLLLTLSQSQSISYLRNILFGIIAIGIGQMLKDSFFSGASWLPARPLEDSYALITGASSGLGKSMAYRLFETGYNVILVGRNETVLEDVRKEFYIDANKVKTKTVQGSASKSSESAVTEAVVNPSSDVKEIKSKIESQLASASRLEENHNSPRIEVIPTNLAHPLSSFEILKELKQRGLENKIDILITNAGQGHYGKMHETPWSDLREQLEVNVASTVSLIRLMIPRMILRRRQLRFESDSSSPNTLSSDLQAFGDRNTGGRILVISSVAGEGPGADIATYSAVKAFLSTFALSIRRELFQEGIMVTVAKPGPLTGTKFLSRVPNMKHTPMVFKLPFFAIGVNDAARQIVQAMILGREMVCPGFFTKMQVHIISKLLPASLYAASVQRFWKPFPSFQKSTAMSVTPDSREASDNSICSPDYSDTAPHQQRPSRSDKRSSFSMVKLPLKKWYEALFSGDVAQRANDNNQKDFDTEQNDTHDPEIEAHRLQQAEEEAEMSASRKFSVFTDFSATETLRKDRDLSSQGEVSSAHGSAFSMDVSIDNDIVANSQTNYFSSVKMVHI